MPMPVRSTSAGATPTHCPQDPLSGVGGDVQEAFAQGEIWEKGMRTARGVWQHEQGAYGDFSSFSCALSFK